MCICAFTHVCLKSKTGCDDAFCLEDYLNLHHSSDPNQISRYTYFIYGKVVDLVWNFPQCIFVIMFMLLYCVT